jgi:secreted PhoX family phosphatase
VRDPQRILDLPLGFSYRILETTGDVMSDGRPLPGAPDGMACFALADGTLALMRNHELGTGSGRGAPPEAFNPRGLGGVSRLVLEADGLTRRSSNLVLTGTVRNCAGGPSPWGWLSCEETTQAGHGYVFACDPTADALQPARIIRSYGRFNHEAAAVDPQTLVTYLTEDQDNGCLYRFVPESIATPFEGRLQALALARGSRMSTARMAAGERERVTWVDLEDTDPAGDTLRSEASRKGAATFSRGEGAWFAAGALLFTATSGGPQGRGQVFRLAGDELAVLAAASADNDLDMPDNLCVAPWGYLVLAEDGGGEQFLRVLDASGTIHALARNARSGSEFAGPCFSPDGRTLFVNMQGDGLTLAVQGPFDAVG